jgi:Txe/YoeB family toxin of toxin-antitoxin system
MLGIIREDPFADPPRYEALVGVLRGACSRRINIQHQLLDQVYEDAKVVKVLRLWTHYESRITQSGPRD